MALGIIHEPLPPNLPHWLIAPQDSLTTSLSLPPIPLERASSSAGPRRHSLADSFVKIVYVDRQNSDRRFDNVSHEGLVEVLEDMKRTWGTMERERKGDEQRKDEGEEDPSQGGRRQV